ncbi:MAG: hypothetical protein GY870_01500 [archaeon]|nr:hypothetical protein [archaeon]
MDYNDISFVLKIIDAIIIVIMIGLLLQKYKKRKSILKLYIIGMFSVQLIGLFLLFGNYIFHLTEMGGGMQQLMKVLGTYIYIVSGEFLVLFTFNIFISGLSEESIKKNSIIIYFGINTVLATIGIVNAFLFAANEIIHLTILVIMFLIQMFTYLLIITQGIRTSKRWNAQKKLTGSIKSAIYSILLGTLTLFIAFIFLFIDAVSPTRTVWSIIGWILHLFSMIAFFIAFTRSEKNI